MHLNDLLTKPFSKIILSNKKDKSFAYNKAVVAPVQLKGKQAWQMTLYTDKQAFQENLKTLDELQNRLQELFEIKYKQLNFFGVDEDIELKVSKKGKLFASDSIVYDEAGHKVKLFTYSKKKDSLLLKFTFEYDSFDRLILKHDLINKARCTYKYLPNGNYTRYYEDKNGNKYEGKYTVNEKGQLIKEETKNRRVYLTNYDQYGNWLQLKGETNTNSSLGWFTTITKRTIEYYSPDETDTVYLSSEQLPEFPGGQKVMFQYISDNVIYPFSARSNGIHGRAVCQFVVNKSGDLADIVVVKSSGDNSLDQEAVRVLMSMPKWTPGRSNGEIVRVKYTVPVTFKINEIPE